MNDQSNGEKKATKKPKSSSKSNLFSWQNHRYDSLETDYETLSPASTTNPPTPLYSQEEPMCVPTSLQDYELYPAFGSSVHYSEPFDNIRGLGDENSGDFDLFFESFLDDVDDHEKYFQTETNISAQALSNYDFDCALTAQSKPMFIELKPSTTLDSCSMLPNTANNFISDVNNFNSKPEYLADVNTVKVGVKEEFADSILCPWKTLTENSKVSKRRCPILSWFLLLALEDEQSFGKMIRWVDRKRGIFEVSKDKKHFK